MATTPAAARERKHGTVKAWAPAREDCARAIERYFVVTVAVTVSAVTHLGHNVWTADAKVLYDETGETQLRQFLIAAVDGRLLVNP